MSSPLHLFRHAVPFTGYPYRGEGMACNLCGGAEALTVAETDRRLKRLRSVACTGCGLIRTDPMPTAAELEAYYASAYRAAYQFALGRRPPRHHLNRSRREAAFRAELLAPALRPGARVLDFGSGSGEFLAAARARGCAVTGVEPGRSYATYARAEHGARVLDRLDALPADEVFDVVTVHHVLEHLRDPVDTLARLADRLAPEGVLYAAVPNMAATGKPPHERFHFAHVHGFVRDTLDRAARRAGLTPDPGYWREDTTAVYRRSAAPVQAEPGPAGPGLARELAAALAPVRPGAYLASGAWLGPMVRRNAKAIRDTFASR
ncbi:methyltransferase type 11 [Methylobacterium variabile]|jgi:2-polyprenyl-3-methyl-5-hydroxy-6-metoxy-1,4-benzoquinol methylase|uniref:Methyltransferase type 11 n=1 Tax=Methylobacterium variabile TaxID=298794 RepID=A0A0J6SA90_9HYPH|nr:class I SAM-dependent methyltransferase [Methylobacterium variabile]KMO30594.1 methyltransferase type 11 [Methylobacterium variabile]